MLANCGVNAILGFTAFLLTYFCSFANNTWQTSIYRAIIGFLLFFVLGYILRFVLHQIGYKRNSPLSQKQNMDEGSNLEAVHINQVEEIPKEQPSFQAIPLHSLHIGEDAKNPEKVSNTIHIWTSQNKEG